MISLLLAGLALAGGDSWTSSVGGQWVRSQAVAEDDLDLLLGQRLRWTLADGDAVRARALVDAKLTVDPDAEIPLERMRIWNLGVELEGAHFIATVGRSPVLHGGPRLVDGVQLVGRTRGGLELGAWGGLAPDLFTTLPWVRPGGGPILAWVRSKGQVSTVGEVLVAAGGLDRVGWLTEARYAPGPGLQTTARADVQLADAEGRGGLADGAVSVRLQPHPVWRTDLLYDAFSSLRYQQTTNLDPRIRRFSTRILDLGLAEGITQDSPDPTLNHLVVLRNELRRPEGEVRPRIGLDTRYRYHPDPANQYARIQPRLGVDGLAGQRLSLDLDGSILWIDGGMQEDAGVGAAVDLLPSGDLALDGSFRVLLAPDDYGDRPGWYTDGFVQGMAGPVVVIAGASLEHEPRIAFEDVAIGAFCQLSTTVKRARPVDRGGSASQSPRP